MKISHLVFYILAKLQRKARLAALRDCDIHSTSRVEAGSQFMSVSMGRHSFCGYDCTAVNADIGSFCSISDQVCIGGAGHPLHYVSTSPVFLSHRDSVKAKFSRHVYEHCPITTIGHDVWIGFGAKVRSGVTIGNGAVVGMGSVVTRDVEPYAIVAGNPAKVVSHRFSKRIADALNASEWWEMGDVDLRAGAELFTQPEDFLKSQGLL